AHRVEQSVATGSLAALWDQRGARVDAIERLHRSVGVEQRYLTLPIDDYTVPRSFTASNDLFVQHATDLAEAAVREALDRAGLAASDLHMLALVTSSGLAVPSIDARLANRLDLRRDLKRLPLFGLGCVGGAAGLARAHPQQPERAEAAYRAGARLAHRRVGLPSRARQRAAGHRLRGAPRRCRSVPRSARPRPRRRRAVARPPGRAARAAAHRDRARTPGPVAAIQLARAPPPGQRLERRRAVHAAGRRIGRSAVRRLRPADGDGARVQHGDGPASLDLNGRP